MIPAIAMVSLFAAACGGSPTPVAPPLVEVPAAGPADLPITSAAPAAAPTPYKLDLEDWCNAPKLAPGAATASKEDRPRLISAWIAAQLRTERAKELAHNMGTLEQAKRVEVLRKETAAQGILKCQFLDELH
ncbi:MAG: hypothetical protein ABJE95_04725 [Byssovorax sp.]